MHSFQNLCNKKYVGFCFVGQMEMCVNFLLSYFQYECERFLSTPVYTPAKEASRGYRNHHVCPSVCLSVQMSCKQHLSFTEVQYPFVK